MNRIESITTGVRPIKKFFVIDPEDLNGLKEVIRISSIEIGGFTNNIILPLSRDFYGENVARFIRWHDPDVLLNYSSEESRALEKRFRVDTFSAPSMDEVRRMASTKLHIWDNLPQHFTRYEDQLSREVIAAAEGDPIDLFVALHFGIAGPDFTDLLEETIFRGVHIKEVDLPTSLRYVHDHEHSLAHLSLGLSMAKGGGWSIYSRDNNPNGYFSNKPTIVLGSYADIGSMAYFWNQRVVFPFNHTLWLPIELADFPGLNLRQYTHLACDIDNLELAGPLKDERTIVDAGSYYFSGYDDRWLSFEHTGTASVMGARIKVDHPSHKLFSRRGLRASNKTAVCVIL